jgi:hypothetical protein
MADDTVYPDLTNRHLQQLAAAAIHDDGWQPTPRGDPDRDWQLSPHKLGEDYDNCPRPDCGQRDVEPAYRIKDSTVYQCPGCATCWNRDGKQALAHFENGQFTHVRGRGTQAADRGRVWSLPSAAFRKNFDRIDWSR